MTPLTPETLPRHELSGLPVEVVDATNPDLVGIAGRVRRETASTLVVAGADRVRQVPKAEATFAFVLPDDRFASMDHPVQPSTVDGPTVTVAGRRLCARPAERTETRGDTIWQSA